MSPVWTDPGGRWPCLWGRGRRGWVRCFVSPNPLPYERSKRHAHPPQSRSNRYGYSAKVRLWVELGGESKSIGQAGPDRVYFDKPVSIPAQPAILVIEIDGDAKRRVIKILGETVTGAPPLVRSGPPPPPRISIATGARALH